MKKQLLSFVLVLCLLTVLLSGMTFSVSAVSPTSGFCGDRGDNLQWTFDPSTGALTISGSGNMKNWYSSSDVPWYDYTSDIKTLAIGSEVTSIGIMAFSRCTGLASVTIPDSVVYIEGSAFHACTGLTDVIIGKGVYSIGMSAFEKCTSLTSLTIPEGVGYIDFTAFNECTSITSVTIPGSVSSIGPSAFSNCSSLALVTINSGVSGISMSAFSGCTGLTSVVIPDSVTIIDAGAFRNCTSLTDVYYSGTEEMWNRIQINAENNALLNGKIHFNYKPFLDVQGSDYYALPVLWAVGKDITNGTGNDRFSPTKDCTRGQIVTFLWRAADCPEPGESENSFVDVAPDAYYYKAILWAVEQGITLGTGPDRFSPDAPCTRGQAVTFLWRAAGSPKAKNNVWPFDDVPEGIAFYYDAVLWAVEEKITTGTSATKFSPDNTCTRGQIVTFLYRAYN